MKLAFGRQTMLCTRPHLSVSMGTARTNGTKTSSMPPGPRIGPLPTLRRHPILEEAGFKYTSTTTPWDVRGGQFKEVHPPRHRIVSSRYPQSTDAPSCRHLRERATHLRKASA